jgi:hypothetical protein
MGYVEIVKGVDVTRLENDNVVRFKLEFCDFCESFKNPIDGGKTYYQKGEAVLWICHSCQESASGLR